jgi:hypothetical protein
MGKLSGDQSASSPKPPVPPKEKRNTAFSLSQEPLLGEAHPAPAPVPATPPATATHPHPAGLSATTHSVAPATSTPSEYEDLGPLPETYHEDTVFLTARDPRWVFSYWDVDFSRFPAALHRFNAQQFFLRITRADGALENTVEIKPEARNWYVPVQIPDAIYFAEMGYYDRDGRWNGIVKSGAARTPADALAPEAEATFATVPAQTSFERLLELVSAHMEEGESLLQAVARITGEGRRTAFASGQVPGWTEEQRALLAALLGESLVDRMGLGSAEIDQLLRKQLLEKLQSESASELAARLYQILGPESALSSGAFSSGAWEQLGGAAAFSSGALFSGVTSWGSSWSGQPFSTRRERNFFMHVNAEIIFYGGTDPDATVWIDGKEIRLQPDGTFRYHFLLPDGDHAVPILARSPDGVEQRSATLSFIRGTARTGDVGATAQPAELEPLIGRKN